MMAFNSVSELFYMGGHGLYVWPAFVITIILLLLLLIRPLFLQKRLLKEIYFQNLREKSHSKRGDF